MVAHAIGVSRISYLQGDTGACHGHLHRGDVGEDGFGVHRFVQGLGEFRGASFLSPTVFPYLLWRASHPDALCGWCGRGRHLVGQEPVDALRWLGCYLGSADAGV